MPTAGCLPLPEHCLRPRASCHRPPAALRRRRTSCSRSRSRSGSSSCCRRSRAYSRRLQPGSRCLRVDRARLQTMHSLHPNSPCRLPLLRNSLSHSLRLSRVRSSSSSIRDLQAIAMLEVLGMPENRLKFEEILSKHLQAANECSIPIDAANQSPPMQTTPKPTPTPTLASSGGSGTPAAAAARRPSALGYGDPVAHSLQQPLPQVDDPRALQSASGSGSATATASASSSAVPTHASIYESLRQFGETVLQQQQPPQPTSGYYQQQVVRPQPRSSNHQRSRRRHPRPPISRLCPFFLKHLPLILVQRRQFR